MLHGLTGSIETNWGAPGWIDDLRDSHRLVLLDFRGHGRSAKPHRESDYSLALLANDALAVLDREGIPQAAVMGYSMGGMVAVELLLNHPERFTAAIIGGAGARSPRRGEWRTACQEEESEPRPPRQRRRPGSRIRDLFFYLRHLDPMAIRALRHSVFRGGEPVDASRLHEIHVPTLVVTGTRDAVCPAARELASAIAGAQRVLVGGRGHLAAVEDPRFKEAVRRFLSEVESGSPQRG